jgi:hypothetical protein
VNLGFCGKVEVPYCQRGVKQRSARSTCGQHDVSEEPRDEVSKIGNGVFTLMEIDLLVKQKQRKWWDREEQASGRVPVKHQADDQ